MTQPLTTAELLRRALESDRLDMHTALPGIVKSYDASDQTAEVELALTRPVPAQDEDDSDDELETLPILVSVPVAWPRAGGFYLHFPMAAGDSVLVVFSELDMNTWRNTGDVSDPAVGQRHSLSGAVAIPGLFPRTNPNPDADSSDATLGAEGGIQVTVTSSEVQIDGNTDAAALASKVDNLESALNSLISAYNGHTHTTNATVDTGAAANIQPTTATGTTSNEAPFASDKLKLGG